MAATNGGTISGTNNGPVSLLQLLDRGWGTLLAKLFDD